MSTDGKFEQFELGFSKASRMPIATEQISTEQAAKIVLVSEGHYSDVKAIDIGPAKLTKSISAFANADGADLYVGIDEVGEEKRRSWRGFPDVESANGHLQIFEQLFPLGSDFQYEFLQANGLSGFVLHIQIAKTQAIVKASNGIPYVRRGAQSLPVDTPDKLKRLEYAKGIASFEGEPVNAPLETVTESETVKLFIRDVVPSSTPAAWLRKQLLVTRDNRPTVAATLLFSDEPQAILPKRCGVKVYRYKTKEPEGFREALTESGFVC